MRMRRPATVLALGLLAGVSLVGCRTSPNVAAYVGDERITVDELQQAVDRRLADPDIAAAVGDDVEAYTREVLTTLVDREVLAAAAERYDVDVDGSDVRDRISDLLGGGDPDDAYPALAAEGLSREDVDTRISKQLVFEEVAFAAGEVEEADEEELRERYRALLTSQEGRPVGVITVGDQAAADELVAALQADPSSYAGLAAQNPGQTTLATVDVLSPAQLPPDVAAALLAAPAGSVFSRPVPEFGGVVVVLVPAFEDVAFALGEQTRGEAQEAGGALVGDVAEDLDISVNPRFGTYDEGQVVESDGGVVRLLDEPAEPADAATLPPVDGES